MPSRLLIATVISAITGIASAQSSGTAFVVAPGLLVTNQHVVDGCGAIEVIAADGRRPATVVDSVEQIDLALLRVYGLRGGVASLRTQSSAMLGESATVFGFPLGGALSSTGNFTTGVVSSLRGLRDAAGEIQITAPVQPGNSGGPVLDHAGSVIGVVQSKLDALRVGKITGDIPQNVNFAISLDVLADFLAKNNVSFTAIGRQSALETTRVAQLAQAFTYKVSCTSAGRSAKVAEPEARSPIEPTTPPARDYSVARYLYNPPPDYPTDSRKQREQGRVLLLVQISAEGVPVDIKIHQSSGFERLDSAATYAVRQWRFLPATRGGRPLISSVIVPVSFKAPDKQQATPTGGEQMPNKLVKDTQVALNNKGFSAGPSDGILGIQTKNAISAAQQALKMTITGLPSDELLVKINATPCLVFANKCW